MSVKHRKVATLADQAGVEVNKGEWNDGHDIVESGGATLDVGAISDAQYLKRSGVSIISGVPAESEITFTDITTNDVSITKHGFAPKAPNDTAKFLRGDATWAALPASSSTLNGITAATGAVTIASGNNTGIVWNWANTTNSTVSFTFGETSAATGGTSTSDVPNQVLLKLTTLASSTQSPLSVYSRGSHVFSVSPTAVQLLVASGATNTPSYSFAGGSGAGFSYSNATGLQIAMSANGFKYAHVSNDPNEGTFAVSSASLFPSQNSIGATLSVQANSNAFVIRSMRNSADATGSSFGAIKSRGTGTAPTVITTGDALGLFQALGYVGATNTYREAGRIEFDSAGTITDSTSGIGSVIHIKGTTQGTDTTPQDTLVITGGSTATIKFGGSGMFTANGTVATAMSNLGPAGSHTTIQKWLTITDNGDVVGYVPVF